MAIFGQPTGITFTQPSAAVRSTVARQEEEDRKRRLQSLVNQIIAAASSGAQDSVAVIIGYNTGNEGWGNYAQQAYV